MQHECTLDPLLTLRLLQAKVKDAPTPVFVLNTFQEVVIVWLK